MMDHLKNHGLNFGNKIPSAPCSILDRSAASLDFQRCETREASRNGSSGLMAAFVGDSDIEDSCETSISEIIPVSVEQSGTMFGE